MIKLSVQVSYKKQATLGIIGIAIILLAVELIANVWWVTQIHCEFEQNEIFQDLNEAEKRQLCLDFYNLKTSGDELIPDQSTYSITINDLGFRGAEFSEIKPPNTHRTFMIGGSTMFGAGATSDETTIPGYIQQFLDENNTGFNLEVINAGIQGADSNTELGADEGGDHVLNSTTATNLWLKEGEWTSTTDGPALIFRVGDLIKVGAEIMEVTAVGSGADGTTNNYLTVKRGLYGSTAATHVAADTIYFPFFNEYYDHDRVLSGNTQLVQTDASGHFKSSNFFGYGRVATTAAGLVPGSVCIRFYSKAYQEIPMGGTGVAGGTGGSNIFITSSTSSMLSASTEYSFNLICDDSVETTVSFTTDSSNRNFGGTNGVVYKIQDAIDTATRTAGNNLFGYSCSVGIVDSKLRFTSNSHLSPHDGTNGSKILIEDGAGGTNLLTGAAGIFPDINNSIAAVKPIISPVSVYDTLTYAKSSNLNGMCYDNGSGVLIYNGARVGNISYETGAFDFNIP